VLDTNASATQIDRYQSGHVDFYRAVTLGASVLPSRSRGGDARLACALPLLFRVPAEKPTHIRASGSSRGNRSRTRAGTDDSRYRKRGLERGHGDPVRIAERFFANYAYVGQLLSSGANVRSRSRAFHTSSVSSFDPAVRGGTFDR